MYQFGYGVPVDFVKANKYFIDGAKHSDTYAMLNLGNNYEFGQGFVRSRQNAVYWYQKASELNNGQAKVALRRLGVSR
jgi:enhanced entry protein EnhC